LRRIGISPFDNQFINIHVFKKKKMNEIIEKSLKIRKLQAVLEEFDESKRN